MALPSGTTARALCVPGSAAELLGSALRKVSVLPGVCQEVSPILGRKDVASPGLGWLWQLVARRQRDARAGRRPSPSPACVSPASSGTASSAGRGATWRGFTGRRKPQGRCHWSRTGAVAAACVGTAWPWGQVTAPQLCRAPPLPHTAPRRLSSAPRCEAGVTPASSLTAHLRPAPGCAGAAPRRAASPAGAGGEAAAAGCRCGAPRGPARRGATRSEVALRLRPRPRCRGSPAASLAADPVRSGSAWASCSPSESDLCRKQRAGIKRNQMRVCVRLERSISALQMAPR